MHSGYSVWLNRRPCVIFLCREKTLKTLWISFNTLSVCKAVFNFIVAASIRGVILGLAPAPPRYCGFPRPGNAREGPPSVGTEQRQMARGAHAASILETRCLQATDLQRSSAGEAQRAVDQRARGCGRAVGPRVPSVQLVHAFLFAHGPHRHGQLQARYLAASRCAEEAPSQCTAPEVCNARP